MRFLNKKNILNNLFHLFFHVNLKRIEIKTKYMFPFIILCKNENIGNHGYIGNLILRIYRRNIDGYFGKKILIGKKLIKIHKNVKKTS